MNAAVRVRFKNGDQKLSQRELGIIKAKPIAGLECLAETPLGSLRHRKPCDSTLGPEDLRCRG